MHLYILADVPQEKNSLFGCGDGRFDVLVQRSNTAGWAWQGARCPHYTPAIVGLSRLPAAEQDQSRTQVRTARRVPTPLGRPYIAMYGNICGFGVLLIGAHSGWSIKGMPLLATAVRNSPSGPG